MSNVVDLSIQFALNKTAASVLKRAKIIGAVADELTTILASLTHNEQRFLSAMIGWRIEGGHALPATDLLSHLPALHGLEFGSIQATAAGLADANVIEVVPTDQDEKGETTRVAFVWPALERLLVAGEKRAEGPTLTDPNGNPLRA